MIKTVETRAGFEVRIDKDSFIIYPVRVISGFNNDEGKSGSLKETPLFPKTTRGKYVLIKKGRHVFVSIFVEYKWLAEKDTEYPVSIDPTVSLKSSSVHYATQTYDTDIYSQYPDDNYGGNNYAWVGVNTGTANVIRALFRFGEVDSIPSSCTVRSAVLRLYNDAILSGSSGASTRYYEVHEVTRPWTEGTGTDAVPGTDGATWNTYDGTNPWLTPGGDFGSEIYARCDIPAGGNVGWRQFNLTSLVDAWVKGKPNNGIIIKLSDADEAGGQTYGHKFHTYEDASNFPVLKVTYYLGGDSIYYMETGYASASGHSSYQYTNMSYPWAQDSPIAIDSYELLAGGDATVYGPYRGFIKFDLSSLPRTMTITAASIDLYLYSKFDKGATIDMHKVTSYWDEKGMSWVSWTA